MDSDPKLKIDTIIRMVNESIEPDKNSRSVSSLSGEDKVHVERHIDELIKGRDKILGRYTLGETISPDDTEAMMTVLSIYHAIKCLSELNQKGIRAQRQKQYIENVRGVYRRRRCD